MARKEDEWQNIFDQDKFNEDLLKHYQKDVDQGSQMYQKIEISRNLSFLEARSEVLQFAAKVDFVSKTISSKGQLPIEDLFKEVACIFDNVEELEQFLYQMSPIFLYLPDRLNPRNTSDGFRKLVFHFAKVLRDGEIISDSNVENIIKSFLPETSNVAERTKNTFHQHEIFIDFKSLRSLASQVSWFIYDAQSKTIKLSPSADTALPLFIDVLRPRFLLKRDQSRRICCHSVVTKSYPYYLRGRIIGARKMSGYSTYLLSMFLEKNENGLHGLNIPSKTYIVCFGEITPNEACQVTVRTFSQSFVGPQMFQNRSNWGDIVDKSVILEEETSKPEESLEIEMKRYNLRELAELQEQEMLKDRIWRNFDETKNVLKKLEKQEKESKYLYEKWNMRREEAVKYHENPKKYNGIFYLGPRPDVFILDPHTIDTINKAKHTISLERT